MNLPGKLFLSYQLIFKAKQTTGTSREGSCELYLYVGEVECLVDVKSSSRRKSELLADQYCPEGSMISVRLLVRAAEK